MADFFQNGLIATLHRLKHRPLESLENELKRFSRKRPMALVLPTLYSELEGDALPKIIEELRQVEYIQEIVIGLDRATKSEFQYAKKFFAELPQPHRVIWQDGPNMLKLHDLLKHHGLSIGEPGKGRNAWFCFGYILSAGRSRAVAIHDCDILTYNRHLLARLFYPVANPNFGIKFCKGYYARVTDRLNGRVTRLFVTPLVRSLKKILGTLEYLEFLDGFRYPLAGEFSMGVDVLEHIRIPSDWGLEVGVLSEVYRNYALKQICQVDIADEFDHKHQPLSEEDPNAGLSKMTIDIAKSIYRTLASMGVVFSEEFFRTIKATYLRTAFDFLEKYYYDAKINGLHFDRHQEEKTIEVFIRSIIIAGEQFLANPMEVPLIPNWSRVISAIPEFYDLLYKAVEEDN
ncbi:MAG: glycosyl transferase [Calditrichaeota bacterium]|nr:glycosyl transferase [Calditrichota bacterium]